jgi:hypothetical protein
VTAEKRAAPKWPLWLLAAAFAAALIWSTLAQSGYECEACMDYEGSSICRTVAAATEEEAGQQAVATACAILTRGVTRGMECQRTPPRSLECRQP